MLLVQGEKGELFLAEAKPDAYKEIARAQPLVGKSWTMATFGYVEKRKSLYGPPER